MHIPRAVGVLVRGGALSPTWFTLRKREEPPSGRPGVPGTSWVLTRRQVIQMICWSRLSPWDLIDLGTSMHTLPWSNWGIKPPTEKYVNSGQETPPCPASASAFMYLDLKQFWGSLYVSTGSWGIRCPLSPLCPLFLPESFHTGCITWYSDSRFLWIPCKNVGSSRAGIESYPSLPIPYPA